MRKTLMLWVIAASLAVTACAGRRVQEQPAPETAPSGAATGAETTGAGDARAGNGPVVVPEDGDGVAGPQEGLLARRVIYFEFDSAEIQGEATDIVAAHAQYLSRNPNTRIRLEGHTDERGTREYNIGLGERRSQSVRRALMLQGAADTQVATVSYGEERPAAAGSDESAWAQNRRVEIVYLTN